MKLLLDMYKGVSKDQRDKVQLMATEKKLRSEIEELRNQLKKTQVNELTERREQGLAAEMDLAGSLHQFVLDPDLLGPSR